MYKAGGPEEINIVDCHGNLGQIQSLLKQFGLFSQTASFVAFYLQEWYCDTH
jgi:hypothetical protein